MSPQYLTILHLLADLQGMMISDYLCKLDTDHVVIMDVCGLSKKIVHAIQGLKTPLLYQFLSGLWEDEFDIVQYRSESERLITLYYSAHPVQRSGNDDKSTSICSDLNAVNEKITNNLNVNVVNQVRQSLLLNLLQHLPLVTDVKKLYSLYGQEYTNLVENNTCSGALPGYTIKITYPSKLKCMLSKLLGEFDKI